MPVDARIPLGFDTSTIYNPVKAQADQIALQKGRDDLQRAQFERDMQPFKRQVAMDEQQLNSINVARAKTNQALQMLDAAQNPAQWGNVRNTILQSGLAKPDEVPENFDPRWVHKARMAHLDFKEQLDNQYRNSSLALQREDLGIRREERAEDRALTREDLDMRREDRVQERELKDRYYGILEKNALTKAGQTIDPLTGEIIVDPNAFLGKPLPSDGRRQILTNIDGYKKVNRALDLLSGNQVGSAVGDKNATGLKGYLPDATLQRIDPKGVDTRAAIADIGSAIVHERSGAAVTASEYPRLKPFIPKANDDPEIVKKKLLKFRDEYERVIEETSEFYRELGYNVPEMNAQSNAEPKASDIKPGSTIKWGDL